MITAHHLVFGRKYGVDFGTFIYSEIDGINGFLPVTKNGTVTFTTDRKGGNTAVQFSNGFIKTINSLPTSNIWSFSFWMKTSQTNSAGLFLMGTYDNDGDFMATINNTVANKLQINERTNTGTGHNAKYANNTIVNDNIWKHLVIIFNANADALNEITVYFNSVKEPITIIGPHNSEKTTPYGNKPLKIGSALEAGNGNFNGALDDVKIFNRPLTQAEITNLYNE